MEFLRKKILLFLLLNSLLFSSSTFKTNSLEYVKQNRVLYNVSQPTRTFPHSTTTDEARLILVAIIIVIIIAAVAGYAIYLMNRKMRFADYI